MRVLRLLRQPAPLALWLGQLFSVTGDKLYAMAVLWLVLALWRTIALGSPQFAVLLLFGALNFVAVGRVIFPGSRAR